MQECTKHTIDAMGDIDQVIREVREISVSIADSVASQSNGVSEIAATMSQSADTSKVIASGINESSIASDEIAKNVALVDNSISNTADGANLTYGTGETVSSLAAVIHHDRQLAAV